MQRTQQVQDFIDRFITQADSPSIDPGSIITDSFGDSPEMANELIELVLAGTKTASCSCLWEWEAENESPLTVGTLAVIIDGFDNPRCILETTEITRRRFDEVDAQFAHDEGEGDLSYEYWRREHWNYFARTLPRIGKEPSKDMPILCERFRVIYQESAPCHKVRK